MHSIRIFFFHKSLFDTTLTAAECDIAEKSSASYETIDEIMEIGDDANDGIFFQIHSVGLPEEPK